METRRGKTVRFGMFELDLGSGELRKGGVRLRLQEQPFQVLAALVENPGEVVSREELIGRLWPDGTTVDFDRGLNAAVTRLRQVLGDAAESPRYVETVARRGYRFLAAVEGGEEEVAVVPAEVVATPEGKKWGWWPVVALAGILVVGGGGWWLQSRAGGTVDRGSVLTAVPLTSEPGVESTATFSPDGSQIAYTWDEGKGTAHVFVRMVGVGEPVRLTQAEEAEYSPAWSRDGRHIAFLRQEDGDRLSLIVATVIGGVERKIADFPAPPWKMRFGPGRRLDWTADSQRLIVGALWAGERQAGLLEVRVDSGERRWILEPASEMAKGVNSEPAVSPDGRMLAYYGATALTHGEIYLLSLGEHGAGGMGTPRQLTFEGMASNPAWTRDGREVLYVSKGRLWRVSVEAGAKPVVVTVAGGGIGLPAVGNGGRLAYTQSVFDTNIWKQDLRGGPPTAVITSTAFENSAEYSPDGSRIAVHSNRSGKPEIWVCGADGKRCVQLTTLKSDTGSPRWSPDGKQIAFDSDVRGRFEVYVVDATGGAARRLSTGGADEAAPSWSRDGRWIYYMSTRTGRGEIWKMSAKGGGDVQITKNGGMMALESMDGKYLCYSRVFAESKLFRSLTDGSGEEEVLGSVNGRAFTVTADNIYYLRREGNGENWLWSFETGTKREKKLARIEKNPMNGLSLAGDGKSVIYTQVDSRGSDLMMVEGFR